MLLKLPVVNQSSNKAINRICKTLLKSLFCGSDMFFHEESKILLIVMVDLWSWKLWCCGVYQQYSGIFLIWTVRKVLLFSPTSTRERIISKVIKLCFSIVGKIATFCFDMLLTMPKATVVNVVSYAWNCCKRTDYYKLQNNWIRKLVVGPASVL